MKITNILLPLLVIIEVADSANLRKGVSLIASSPQKNNGIHTIFDIPLGKLNKLPIW